MTQETIDRIKWDVTELRHTFVCTLEEFNLKYGECDLKAWSQLVNYICICKDGMIRPR